MNYARPIFPFDVRKTAKSFHFSMPPILAAVLLISWAMKAASSWSVANDTRLGVQPDGWDVCRDLGNRALSMV